MTPDEARERFASQAVARLATTGTDGRPHAVPVTFAISGSTVWTAVDHKPKRTQRLKRLDNVRANPQVALLADRYDDDWDELWWVRADGTARVIDDPVAVDRAITMLVGKYRQYAERPPAGPVIEITVQRWTGWSAR